MTQATFGASDYQGTLPENYEKCFVPKLFENLDGVSGFTQLEGAEVMTWPTT